MEERFLISLTALRRRWLWTRSVAGALRGGWWGAWLSVPVFAAVHGLGGDPLTALWLWLAGAAAGGITPLVRPPELKTVALATDRIHELQDRVLTCWDALATRRAATLASRSLLSETTELVAALDPRRTFPNPWVRPLARWLPPALCLLCLALLLPADGGREATAEAPPPHPAVVRLADAVRRLHPRPARRRPLARLLRQLEHATPAGARRLLEAQRVGWGRSAATLAVASPGEGSPTAARTSPGTAAARSARAEDAALEQALRQARRDLDPGAEHELAADPGEPGNRAADRGEKRKAASAGGGEGAGKDGDGSPDFGQGSSDGRSASGGAARPKRQAARESNRTSDKQEAWKQLWEAQRQHMETHAERVALHGSRDSFRVLGEPALGAPGRPGAPSRAVEQGFLQARAEAEAAVGDEHIPAGHREAVKRYFEEIDPR